MSVELEWTGIIADPGTEGEFGHLCEPRAIRLESGEILVSYRSGTHRESANGSPHFIASSDGARTWESRGEPFEKYRPDGWDLRRASLTEVKPGVILVGVLAIDKSSGLPTHNAVTEGSLPIHALFASSLDAGRTWSELWSMGAVGLSQVAVEQVLTAQDGTVLCAYERFKSYDEPGPWRYEAGILRSIDSGATWGDPIIAAATDYASDLNETMWWDPRPACLADGRLVQCYYCFHHRSGIEGPLHIAWSSDSGRTWSAPRPTSLVGQSGYPIPLALGGLVVFQQRRTDQTMQATFSADGGETFGERPTAIYRHSGYSAPGAVGILSAAEYMESMANFTFGHPSGTELEPDRVFVCWYAGEVKRTSIMGAVLRIHRAG